MSHCTGFGYVVEQVNRYLSVAYETLEIHFEVKLVMEHRGEACNMTGDWVTLSMKFSYRSN